MDGISTLTDRQTDKQTDKANFPCLKNGQSLKSKKRLEAASQRDENSASYLQ